MNVVNIIKNSNLDKNCKNRFLCSLCYQEHETIHSQIYISKDEYQDQNGQILVINEMIKEKEKLKSEIKQIQTDTYCKIDSYFTAYLKKLKEEKLNLFFDAEIKSLDKQNNTSINNQANGNIDEIAKAYCVSIDNKFIDIKVIDNIKKKVENICVSIEEGLA